MKKTSKNNLVTLVELPATQFGELNLEREVDWGYDIYSKFNLPPRAIPSLAAVLQDDGWTNVKMIAPQYHKDIKTNGGLYGSRVVGISSITRTLPQSWKLGDSIKEKNPKSIIIFGGMGPSYLIEESLRHGDIIVVGEGEKTFSELMKRLVDDPENLGDIPGIAFRKKNEIVTTPQRALLTPEELGMLPLPYYDEAIERGMKIGALEQERGCPYNCNFCLVTKVYGRGIRHFPIERNIQGIRRLRKLGLGKNIFFTGDNLAGNPRHALELMGAIKEGGLYEDGRTAQISVDVLKNHKLLQAIRDAGIKYLCVGFEAVNDNSLKSLGKPFTSKQNAEAARVFRDYGFWVHGMMMIGTDYDTKKTARETLEWAKKYVDSVQFFIPSPIPGTPFYDKMENEGRILKRNGDVPWHLYDGHHCLIKPANFSPYELQQIVFNAHKDFYSAKNTIRRLSRSPRLETSLGLLAYTSVFNGIGKVIESAQTRQHLEWLKEIS